MKWCCLGFQGHYDSAGERGFAVLIGRNEEHEPVFTLQSRAVEGVVRVVTVEPPGLVSLVTQTGMRFCPWCGTNLEEFYHRSIDALDRPGYRIELPVTDPNRDDGP